MTREFEVTRDRSFFALVMGSDTYKDKMARWMQERLERHADTDSFPEVNVVVHAVYGLWMGMMLDTSGLLAPVREKTVATLLEMTYPKE